MDTEWHKSHFSPFTGKLFFSQLKGMAKIRHKYYLSFYLTLSLSLCLFVYCRDVLFEFRLKFWNTASNGIPVRLLTAQHRVTTARWYSNKTSLTVTLKYILLCMEQKKKLHYLIFWETGLLYLLHWSLKAKSLEEADVNYIFVTFFQEWNK